VEGDFSFRQQISFFAHLGRPWIFWGKAEGRNWFFRGQISKIARLMFFGIGLKNILEGMIIAFFN
jgi:hypothetical protein